MFYPNLLAARIKHILISKGITTKKFVSDLGLNINFLSQLSKNSKGTNTETLYNICKYLGVSADYLLGLSNNLNEDDLSKTAKRFKIVVLKK